MLVILRGYMFIIAQNIKKNSLGTDLNSAYWATRKSLTTSEAFFKP